MPATGQYGKTPPTCTYAPGSDVEFNILITAYHGKSLHKLLTMPGLPSHHSQYNDPKLEPEPEHKPKVQA